MGRCRVTYEEVLDLIHKINPKYDLIFNNKEWNDNKCLLSTPVEIVHYNCEGNNGKDYIWKTSITRLIHHSATCPCCKMKENKIVHLNTTLFINRMNEIYPNEFTLLSEFKSVRDKVKLRHNSPICNYYEWEVKAGHIINDKCYCPICSKINSKNKISESNTKTTDEFKKEVYKLVGNDYTVLGEYTRCDDLILMRHNCKECNNYEYKVRPRDFIKGNRCPKCSHRFSKEENDLREFIKSFYDKKIIFNERNILSSNKELDIYLPEDKVAIEYDGLYWHSDEYKPNDYHLNKTKECEELGIHLIQIFSDEWIFKNEIIKNKIKHILGYDDGIKVYARNCIIKEINDKKIKNEFLDKNHIQGKYDHSFLSLGLFYNDELVSIMTFRKQIAIRTGKSKNKPIDNNIIEIARYANDLKYRVIGGFGKLFSYFINNYDYNEIITFADRRYSFKNNVYSESSYFEFNSETKPSYYYINNKDHNEKRYNRTKFTKNKLMKLHPEYADLSELQIMQNKLNYRRVYDCGNLKYIYKKEK